MEHHFQFLVISIREAGSITATGNRHLLISNGETLRKSSVGKGDWTSMFLASASPSSLMRA